jgi:hypothetical protein
MHRRTCFKCSARGSLTTAGNIVSRSFCRLLSLTLIWLMAKSMSLTRRRRASSTRRPQTRESPRLYAVPLEVTHYTYGAGGLPPFSSFPKEAGGRGVVRNRMTNTIKTVMTATV